MGAFATTSPARSTTVPVMVPVACANAAAAKKNTIPEPMHCLPSFDDRVWHHEICFASLEVRAVKGRHTAADRIPVGKPHRLDVRPDDRVPRQRAMMTDRHRGTWHVGREVP